MIILVENSLRKISEVETFWHSIHFMVITGVSSLPKWPRWGKGCWRPRSLASAPEVQWSTSYFAAAHIILPFLVSLHHQCECDLLKLTCITHTSMGLSSTKRQTRGLSGSSHFENVSLLLLWCSSLKCDSSWTRRVNHTRVLIIGPPRPKRRKCLYLMETKERGNWTWCILSSYPSYCVMVCIAPVRRGRTPQGTSSRSWSGGRSRWGWRWCRAGAPQGQAAPGGGQGGQEDQGGQGGQDVQDYLRGRTRFFHERVRIQLRAESPKVQNNPMWILCRRQRISLWTVKITKTISDTNNKDINNKTNKIYNHNNI